MARFFKSLWRGAQEPVPAQPDANRQAAEDAKNRGNGLLSAGDIGGAIACYQESVRLDPSYAEASNNLGYAYFLQRKWTEAQCCLTQAVALDPRLVPAHLNLGRLSAVTGDYVKALASFAEAHRLAPSDAGVAAHLGNELMRAGRVEEALGVFALAAENEPHSIEAHINVGSALKELGKLDESIAAYRQALSLGDHPDAYHLLGVVHQERREWMQAADCYAKACALAPDFLLPHWNAALLALLRGDYEAGWRHYEMRLASGDERLPWLLDSARQAADYTPERMWRGEPLAGERLLVWTEQGLGDTLMMLRYLPLLAAKGAAEIIVVCEPALERLVAGVPGVAKTISKGTTVPTDAFDKHCSFMSLPYCFATRVGSIPARVPFLPVPDAEIGRWHSRCEQLAGLRVGLVWGGRTVSVRHASRSLALDQLASLAQIPGVTLVSLQKGEQAAQLPGSGLPVVDWMSECRDMLDTAALIANLDLVVSIDTSVAHLAGGLGKPVWLMNRFDGDWRWMLDRSDSPWYPSLRIFRQHHADDWDSVLHEVREALQAAAATPRRGR